MKTQTLEKRRNKLYRRLSAVIGNDNVDRSSALARNVAKRIWAIESQLDLPEHKRLKLSL